MVKLRRIDLARREAVERGDRGQDVAVGIDLDVLAPEDVAEKPLARLRGEVPVLAPIVHAFAPRHLGDAVRGGQDDAAGLEDAVHGRDGLVDLEDHLQRLCDHDAVKAVVGEYAARRRDRRRWSPWDCPRHSSGRRFA